ncbi:aldehyde dehydrogenase domain-containing protein [Kalaharituber pfeilii]|nr:aldehyde dehydrogenase domain-containing protein [Kalaharituber pfeilii]
MANLPLSTTIKLPNGKEYEQPLGLFINNKFVPSIEGKTFEVINPTNEEVITSVHEATAKDVDVAVAAARKAFEEGAWPKTTPSERGRLLAKLGDLIERDAELLAFIDALDNGKSISLARGDIDIVLDTIRYYAGWADKVHGKVVETAVDKFNYIRYEPIGVCGQIIPWNFPLMMWAWKIAPALATGNTVVLKTAEQTPLSALVACKLVIEAGFPPGVLNVLSGFGKTAGAAISRHMDIDKVAFTGSTAVGREIMKAAADSNLKKVTLELGGKSPNIVFNDADIDEAIYWAYFGIFFNHGQCCCAGSRIFVQEGIYEEFVEKFKARIKENVIGDPFNEETFQGPQVSQGQFDRIMGYINHGKQAGAKVEIGGERYGNKGYFIQPTLFSNVRPDMKIMKEEIFGPVAGIAKFKGIDEAVKFGNDTNYGLAAAIHTKDLKTALEVSNKLKAGTVWVNTCIATNSALPFGGYKESGIGREQGKAALANYTQAKTVQINIA